MLHAVHERLLPYRPGFLDVTSQLESNNGQAEGTRNYSACRESKTVLMCKYICSHVPKYRDEWWWLTNLSFSTYMYMYLVSETSQSTWPKYTSHMVGIVQSHMVGIVQSRM